LTSQPRPEYEQPSMTEAWIAGVGMTDFGVHRDRTVKDLTREALALALDDAGAELSHLEAAMFANVGQAPLEGQFTTPGQISLRAAGLGGIPVVNVENACASGSTALQMAVACVLSGTVDVALAIGVEKLNVGDWDRQMTLFDGVLDAADPEAALREAMSVGGYRDPAEVPGRRTRMMDVYAAWGRGHMRDFGTTQEHFAAVAAKNHAHSATNPKSHFRRPMSREEVLAGRPLAFPLTVPMCAPLTDGGAAAIVCSERGLQRLRGRRSRAVRVRACVLVSGVERDPHDWSRHVGRRAALKAYETAGFGPHDLSVAEVHDATAVGEIIQTECLGLCAPGEGGPLAARGETSLGGRIPVNPSGGLESKGHPLAATGLGQIYELVLQLRGEAAGRQVAGAKLAIAENGGGILGVEEATCCVTILARD
jgi:acetyl-CoA acetyltransferase